MNIERLFGILEYEFSVLLEMKTKEISLRQNLRFIIDKYRYEADNREYQDLKVSIWNQEVKIKEILEKKDD